MSTPTSLPSTMPQSSLNSMPQSMPQSMPNSTAIENKENLKLWLCELTHLTPIQVERLMDQMALQQSNSLERAIAKVG